jgi:hypothetical protein
METQVTAKAPQVEVPRGHTIQKGKERVLGKVPKLKTVSKSKQKKKSKKPYFKEGQEVYLTAFMKKDKKVFYVCRAVVLQCPGPQDRQVYKVKIVAVGDRPVGGTPVVKQGALLGRTITKRTSELQKELPAFMCPPGWIELKPEDGKLNLATRDRDGVIDAGVHGTRKDAQPSVTRKQAHRQANGSYRAGSLQKGSGPSDGKTKTKGQETP